MASKADHNRQRRKNQTKLLKITTLTLIILKINNFSICTGKNGVLGKQSGKNFMTINTVVSAVVMPCKEFAINSQRFM